MDDIEHIQINIADYTPHPRNYNEHPDPQVGEIAESLRLFGQVKPVVVWREWYIAGHGVVLGAQRLGWTQLKAERLPADWPEYKALAYLAADNELARGASPNLQALAALAKDVQAEDAGLGKLAAGGEDGLRRLAQWMKEPAGDDPGPQIDRAEELREKWGVESGQLWQLGEHRVICGDCTDAGVVARVMGGEKAEMVFTDPPYNVASESRNYAADKSKAMDDLKNAQWDHDFDIAALFPVLDLVMAKDCAVYVCTSHWLVQTIWEWMWGWSDFCSYVIWCKPNPMPSLSKRHWTWATEIIPYAVRGKHISNFPAEGHALNWWSIPKSKETNHPTEKVLEVPERAMAFSSNAGMVVFDGFLGSGTTLIACERLNRRCRGVEISPAYVAVTLQRWADMTGRQPVLVED